MEPWVSMAAAAAGAVGIVVAFVLWIRARRRRVQVYGGYESRISGIRTSYTSLTSGVAALDAGDYSQAFDIGLQLLRRPQVSSYPTAAIHGLVGTAALELGRFKTASSHLSAAIASSGRGELLASRSTLLRLLAVADLQRCDHAGAVELATKAKKATKDIDEKMAAIRVAALALLMAGDRIDALALVREAEELAADDIHRASTNWLKARIVAADGDLDEAAELLVDAQRAFLDAGRSSEAGGIVVDIADIAEQRNQPSRAVALLRDAATGLVARPHAHHVRGLITARLAGAEANAGDLESARLHAKEADDAFSVCETKSNEIFLPWAEARIASAMGDLDAAASAYATAMDKAVWLNAWYWRDRIALEVTP
jgi:hypothetical protein